MSSHHSVSKVLADLREAGRFAPRPTYWADFHRAMTRGFPRDEWPALPLILSAHWSTSAAEKHRRLEEHLAWADQHDRLDDAVNFLLTLPDEGWRPMPVDQWTFHCGDL